MVYASSEKLEIITHFRQGRQSVVQDCQQDGIPKGEDRPRFQQDQDFLGLSRPIFTDHLRVFPLSRHSDIRDLRNERIHR